MISRKKRCMIFCIWTFAVPNVVNGYALYVVWKKISFENLASNICIIQNLVERIYPIFRLISPGLDWNYNFNSISILWNSVTPYFQKLEADNSVEFTSNFEPMCQYPDVAYTCECASELALCMPLAHWNWKSNQSKSVISEFV